MSDVLKIERGSLLKMMDRLKSREATQASERSADRAEIKSFLEDAPGLHKKALSDIRRLDKLEGHKRLDYLRSFDLLREIMEDEGRWKEEQGDLLDDVAPDVSEDEIVGFGDEDDDSDPGPVPIEGKKKSNVTQMART